MSRQVMVVDDDPYIRIAVKELLEPEGLEVLEADGGDECLEHMEEGFQGVVLMDVMMPEMDGWDTIRALVDHGYQEGNTILMLTARETPDERMQGLQGYITDYLTKPIEPDELVAIIQQYV